MKSQRRAAFAALLLAPLLAACGFSAQTDQVYQPATGVSNRDGQVDVLNALIVSGGAGSGTLSTTLVNKDQTTGDQLTGVTGENANGSQANPIDVPAAGAVNLSTDGAVSITGTAVTAGSFVKLTLNFASGQSTTVTVPVVRNDGDYADVPLPKVTKPSATATSTP